MTTLERKHPELGAATRGRSRADRRARQHARGQRSPSLARYPYSPTRRWSRRLRERSSLGSNVDVLDSQCFGPCSVSDRS
jgi:hypothetical protein